MFCKNCGSPVNDEDMVCKNCGALTDYGEKVSRHEAMPPTNGSGVNPDGSLNRETYNANRNDQGVNLNDQFGGAPNQYGQPGGGYYPPYSAQNTNNPSGQGGYYYNPQNAQYREQPSESGSNGFAIAGFVCAFFFSLLGLIFSIIGLNKSKNLGGSGRGLAIAGIVISIVGWIFSIIAINELAEMYRDLIFGADMLSRTFVGFPLL